MGGVVYLILNKVNGKRYVGQTTQPLKVRMAQHMCGNCVVDKAIQKYGIENFYCGVIKTCASKAELNYLEKFFIAVLKSKKPYGYNLTDGGEGTVGYHLSSESRAKISAKNSVALLGNKNTLGYHHTSKSRAKISVACKGKPKSLEWCAKISAMFKGRKKSLEHRAKIGVANRVYTPFKNLLREIDERQLTYIALGKILGLSFQSVSRKMRGERKFTESDKVKLEKFFGKPADYLLERNF